MDAPPTTTAEAPVVATDPPAPFLSAESSYDADPPPPPPPGEDDAADANAEETKSRSPEADGDGDSATPAPAVVDADDDATPMSPADPLFATGAAIQEDASDAPDVDAAAPPAATARRRPQTARPSRGGASSASASESSKPLPGKPSSASSRPKSAMRPASGLKSSRPTSAALTFSASDFPKTWGSRPGTAKTDASGKTNWSWASYQSCPAPYEHLIPSRWKDGTLSKDEASALGDRLYRDAKRRHASAVDRMNVQPAKTRWSGRERKTREELAEAFDRLAADGVRRVLSHTDPHTTASAW
ncbi:uncharacterized protein MICPUCDRAFT_51391 [Micromonas pusilla CCMP1545]|uniref:Predicted protein n=1 Tax=Micromonas pusilla (strain CCMP1545) TaxID=564608 RepID=C1N1G2_MICPC|nr:uncharacterized protein MICPUCDRAFT_51391 [Micromonas pusilla CCMP1545]EEH54188.1 predicted protein [Micromonas pusilla CCMP1545]|eukprot:XP_003061558.1 predicted protein [Micromonas pusilla CCMP1545]